MSHYALETPYFQAESPAAADEYISDLFEYALVYGAAGNRTKAIETLAIAKALDFWFDGLVATEEIVAMKDRIEEALSEEAA